MRISNGIMFVLFFVLGIIISIGFFVFGLPSLEGELKYQLYADTTTYENLASGTQDVSSLIGISSNLFGPVFVFQILGENRINVFIFNLLFVAVSLYFLTRNAVFDRFRLVFLLSTNALFMFSFFGVNKEIFIFGVCVALFRYALSPSWRSMLIAMLLACLVRWQFLLFCFMFLATISLPTIKNYPKLILVMQLALATIIYGLFKNSIFYHVDLVAVQGAKSAIGTAGSGIFPLMLEIQRSFGYFLVVIPKTLQLYLGMATKFDLNMIKIDFWNYFVVAAFSIQNVFLTAFLALRWKHVHRNVLLLIFSFCILFSLTPIFSPRYFYPVSLFLIFSACSFRLRSRIDAS